MYDVCIIGAGFTGLSAAYRISRSGYSVLLIDKNGIGMGASGFCGGQVLSGLPISNSTSTKKVSRCDLRKINNLIIKTQNCLRKNVKCDLDFGPSFTAFRKKQHLDTHFKETITDQRNVFTITRSQFRERRVFLNENRFYAVVQNHNDFCINPKVLISFFADQIFYTKYVTFQLSTANEIVRTKDAYLIELSNNQGVAAKNVIIATNAYNSKYLLRNNDHLSIYSFQHEFALDPRFDTPPSAFFEQSLQCLYYRFTGKNSFILGSGFSQKDCVQTSQVDRAKRITKKVLPSDMEAIYQKSWSRPFSLTRSQLPVVFERSPGLYVAYGYSGHGIVLSVLAGRLISDAIMGKRDNFNVLKRLHAVQRPWFGKSIMKPAIGLVSFIDRNLNTIMN